MSHRVVVTGSKGLIGAAVTEHFRRNGRDVLELDLALGNDLSDEKFVKEWFAANQARYLVNLFALNDHVESARKSTSLFDVSLDSVRDYLEANLVALFSVCREFARANRDAGGGIVNFSSTYGLVSPRNDIYDGAEKHIGYSVSKGGVLQLSRHLAVHLAPKFRVNCVVPGGVAKSQPDSFKEKYARHAPLGRMMERNELNGLMDLLCSEGSSYMTGSVICADGGWTCL